MRSDRPEGEVSLSHMSAGTLASGIIAVLTRRFVLEPAFGPVTGKDISMLLLFFLLGYLAFPVASKGHFPLPLISWRRLRSGFLVAVIVGVTIIVPDRLWP